MAAKWCCMIYLPESVEAKRRADTLEGRVYREIARLAREHKDEILARYPKIMRRVSGYNLDEFIKPQPFNLSRILVGSEGTLGTVVEAKMRLVPKPKWTAMDVIHFYSDQEALGMLSGSFANGALCDGIHRQDDPQFSPR